MHLVYVGRAGAAARTTRKNLWPQSYQGTAWNAHVKDQLEDRFKEMVCKNKFLLAQAQQGISTDRIDAYKKHIGPTPSAQ